MKLKNINSTIIGKNVYLIDNSYQHNLITGEDSFLAGTTFDDEEVDSPLLVTIISEPYKVKTNSFGKQYEHEFITVLYNNEPYIALNNYNESLD